MSTPSTEGSMAEVVRARVEEARESRAFQAYTEVREQVLAMRDREERAAGTTHAPSAYWREELEEFDYMLDAPPLVIAKLRRHCYHLTGLKAYDYRTHKAPSRVARRKAALEDAGGRDLLVPEPELLGGFGFRIDGGLYNVDTLKYNEALIALRRGKVLDELGASGRRPIVWEIGSGWGGFAHQFKTVRPDATLILSDLPEVFLFSATYLMAAFPSAKVVFEGSAEDPGAEAWGDFDFVFVSNTRTSAIRPPQVDLTANMVSFQEMTTEQVDAYVAHAAEVRCPALYSLNRERSLYNPELSGVTASVARHYAVEEVEVLPDSYTAAARTGTPKLKKRVAEFAGRVAARRMPRRRTAGTGTSRPNDYRHLLGRLRP